MEAKKRRGQTPNRREYLFKHSGPAGGEGPVASSLILIFLRPDRGNLARMNVDKAVPTKIQVKHTI